MGTWGYFNFNLILILNVLFLDMFDQVNLTGIDYSKGLAGKQVYFSSVFEYLAQLLNKD